MSDLPENKTVTITDNQGNIISSIQIPNMLPVITAQMLLTIYNSMSDTEKTNFKSLINT